MTQLPEPDIDYERLRYLEKIGDLEYSKPYIFKRGKWIVKYGKKKEEFAVLDEFDNALIFSELVKLNSTKTH